LFNSTGERSWLQERFISIPRYLFRTFTPMSDGTTDKFWVKSKNAGYYRSDNKVDILSREYNQEVASMLNRHRRWWGKDKNPNNLASWTSSLLFASVYFLPEDRFKRRINFRPDLFLLCRLSLKYATAIGMYKEWLCSCHRTRDPAVSSQSVL
jgi:hypothetical protein